MIIRKITVISPAKDSARPYPYGCSISGGLSPILNPMNAIEESKISEKVCADSAISAVLPDSVPTIKFKITRIVFPDIPTIIAFLPLFSLSF